MVERLQYVLQEIIEKCCRVRKWNMNLGRCRSSLQKLKDIQLKKLKDLQLKAGTRVFMFCHGIPNMIVAHGIVVELMSYQGVEKPMDHVKVYVEKVFHPSEKLPFPADNAKTIGEVVHKCINWEMSNVMERVD